MYRSAESAARSEPTGVIVRQVLPIDEAVDLWLADLTRLGYSERTRSTYRRNLNYFLDYLPISTEVSEVREEQILRYLDSYSGISPKTRKPYAQGSRVQADAPLRSFFRWLEDSQKIKRSPMARIKRPKRLHPEDLDVVTVNEDDVQRMLDAATGWREILALNLLIYTGSRRRAVAWLRLSDYDQLHGRLRFREKGAKTIWKDVPDELASILNAAMAAGAIQEGGKYLAAGDPDRSPYLVPPAGPLVRTDNRSDRVIWDIIVSLARRLGIHCHVHALRAAFACFYADNEIGDLDDLREQLGHRATQTTLTYLRRRDRDKQRSKVRSLSWRQPQQSLVGLSSVTSDDALVAEQGRLLPPSDDSRATKPDSPDNLLLMLLDGRAPELESRVGL